MNRKEIVNRIVEKIKKHYQPEKIVIFGSYAWGNPTKDSDVDLLIVKPSCLGETQRTMKIPPLSKGGFSKQEIKELEKRLEKLKIGNVYLETLLMAQCN